MATQKTNMPDSLYAGETKLPSIEGIVLKATAKNYTHDHNALHLMKLDIDTFDKGNLTIHGADYRIDRGEKVRLYSDEGFEHPHDDGNNYFVHGLQILDDSNQVKFQATFCRTYTFR